VLPAIGVCRFWGYDTQLDKLIAVQFTPSGVLTKSVTGWVGDTFVAQRVDNGAIVSLTQLGANAIVWAIESKDRSFIVKQNCSRL